MVLCAVQQVYPPDVEAQPPQASAADAMVKQFHGIVHALAGNCYGIVESATALQPFAVMSASGTPLGLAHKGSSLLEGVPCLVADSIFPPTAIDEYCPVR